MPDAGNLQVVVQGHRVVVAANHLDVIRNLVLMGLKTADQRQSQNIADTEVAVRSMAFIQFAVDGRQHFIEFAALCHNFQGFIIGHIAAEQAVEQAQVPSEGYAVVRVPHPDSGNAPAPQTDQLLTGQFTRTEIVRLDDADILMLHHAGKRVAIDKQNGDIGLQQAVAAHPLHDDKNGAGVDGLKHVEIVLLTGSVVSHFTDNGRVSLHEQLLLKLREQTRRHHVVQLVDENAHNAGGPGAQGLRAGVHDVAKLIYRFQNTCAGFLGESAGVVDHTGDGCGGITAVFGQFPHGNLVVAHELPSFPMLQDHMPIVSMS